MHDVVSTPLGKSMNCQFELKGCVIEIHGRHLFVDLILFNMEEFDVILSMDWLPSYHACGEYFKKEVIFRHQARQSSIFVLWVRALC